MSSKPVPIRNSDLPPEMFWWFASIAMASARTTAKGKKPGPLTPEQILQWFRDADPKLRKLRMTAVAEFAARLQHAEYMSETKFKDATECFAIVIDALQTAANLRSQLIKLQKHVALKDTADTAIPELVVAIDEFERAQGGHLKQNGKLMPHLDLVIPAVRTQIETILRLNGFPRASAAAPNSPAAAILAAVLSRYGKPIKPATAAWRVKRLARTASASRSSQPPPPSGPRSWLERLRQADQARQGRVAGQEAGSN